MSHDHDDHDDREIKHCSTEDLGQLLKTLIEVGLTQNELLARLSTKLDTAICVLEHVSKNTCETLNEVHDQTGLLVASVECGQVCTLCQPTALPCAEPAPPKCAPKACCEVDEPKPLCTYVPCTPSQDEGGSAESGAGSAPPQRAFGTPYPPAVRTDNPDDDANEFPAPQVPRGPFRGFLTPGKAVAPLDFKSAGVKFDPFYILFGRNSIVNPGGGIK